MATYSSVTLSGSTSGRLIAIQTTGPLGTTVHTAASSTGVHDEVHLWAQNLSTANALCFLQLGGTSTLDEIIYTVPGRDGLHTISPGLRLEGGVVTRAYATSTDVLLLGGYVNRITP